MNTYRIYANYAEPRHKDPFDLLGLAVLNMGWYVIVGIGAAMCWALLFPLVSFPIFLAVLVTVIFGWPAGILTALINTAGVLWFRHHCPDLFDMWVTQRTRTRFLTWWRYRRNWQRLMRACHLTIDTDEQRVLYPKLFAIDIGTNTDRVQVRMLAGQAPADYENRVDHLAHAFKAQQCNAVIIAPAIVELRFRFGDALAETVLRPRVDHWIKGKGA